MINVNLSMMVVLIGLYPFLSQWPWLFNFKLKVTAMSNGFNWKFYILIWLWWNYVWLLIILCQVDHEYTTIIDFCRCSREILTHFLIWKKNPLNVVFFSDTVIMRFFKLCIVMNLLGVYIFIVGLVTFTLFQGHRCVRNINCKLCFLNSCLISCLL